jgi:glycosyltransferase 2 family protein
VTQAETQAEPAASRPVSRRGYSTLLRIGASVAMLAVLFTQAPSFTWQDLFPSWTTTTAAWLSAAALLTLAGIVLSALRWQTVLAALDVRTDLSRLVRHNLAGQFVSNVLPTTVGGDVLRVSRLSRDTGESPQSFASVVLERLTGWLVLPALTMVGLLVNPGLWRFGTSARLALGLAVATLVLLTLALAAGTSTRIGGRFVRRDGRRDGWRRFLEAVHLGLTRLRQRPRAAASVLVAGFAYQLVLVLAAVAAAQALGLRPAGLTALLAFFPAVMIAQVLPISISGLGVREAAFVLFLAPLGVAHHEAIALGLLLYLLNMGVSLLGVPAFAAGGRRPDRPTAATPA